MPWLLDHVEKRLEKKAEVNFKIYDVAVSFIMCPSQDQPKYVKSKVSAICFFIYIKLFYKIKDGLELVSLPHFLRNIWRKIFITLYLINWSNVIAWLPLILEILSNMCIVIICCPVCDVINFGINLNLLIKPFLYITKTSRKKM